MLRELSIAATPGVDFDARHGEDFVRFSYCGGEAQMAEAAERLLRW
jgi:aspartate/methionine/tyrosine aminotransferase